MRGTTARSNATVSIHSKTSHLGFAGAPHRPSAGQTQIAQEILESIQSMVQGVQIRGPFAHYETPLQVLSVMMKGASR